MKFTVVLFALLAALALVAADYRQEYLEAERSFTPTITTGIPHTVVSEYNRVSKVADDFTAYREDSKGWEFDALLVASIETKYYTAHNETWMDNWGVHGIWEPAGAYVDPKKAPNSTIRPEWTAANAKRNPDRTVNTLRAQIENEITTDKNEWIYHFKSIKPDGTPAFRNHEWSKHGTTLPMSMRQFANSISSLKELRRICAINADKSSKNGTPFAILVKDVDSKYGKVTILYKPANGYVDCRASGFIRFDYDIVQDSQITPKITITNDFQG